MKITMLGSGTSTGVPMVGCRCDVCTSEDEKNKRLRASILIQTNGKNILLDASTDLRMQALTNNIQRIDAVLFTHAHADHIHGIDELRSFNFVQKEKIPCYGHEDTIKAIKRMFSYIFEETQKGGGKPQLDMHLIDNNPFTIFNTHIQPIEVMHGQLEIYGYLIDKIAYITDCSKIPEASMRYLNRLNIMILGALGCYHHPTHFSLTEAIKVVNELRPKRAVFTHLNHSIDYFRVNRSLPKGMELAYDGMIIDV